MSITAIIPAYNEEKRIQDTISEVGSYVNEIIVIDDASTDATYEKAKAENVIVLKNTTNEGYISALKKGFREASHDIIITVDADGEMPAEKIPLLVKPLEVGSFDMVQGKRDKIVRPSERFLTWIASLKGNVGDSGTGFRAIKKEMALQLELKAKCICGILSLEVLTRGGKITEVPIKLNMINKPRKIAWYHIAQFFYLIKFMLSHN